MANSSFLLSIPRCELNQVLSNVFLHYTLYFFVGDRLQRPRYERDKWWPTGRNDQHSIYVRQQLRAFVSAHVPFFAAKCLLKLCGLRKAPAWTKSFYRWFDVRGSLRVGTRWSNFGFGRWKGGSDSPWELLRRNLTETDRRGVTMVSGRIDI